MYPLFILAAVLAAGPPGQAEEIYPGYTWADLGRGIYVHSQNEPLAGPVDGNSVVIVNADDVFVVDTHIDPAAARAVIAKIREVTDAPVTHVINTHWHDDHANGNHAYREAFPEVRIVAHAATLRELRERWAAMEDQRRETYARVVDRDLYAVADSIEETDPERAIGLRVYAGYIRALSPELPTLELVYPDLVLEDRMVLERDGRNIAVEWLGRANTDGDLIVHLPQDGLLITGDVLVAPIPFAFDAPMLDWIETLARLAEVEVATIVPGHGAIQRDDTYLDRVRELLQATVRAVRDAEAAGVEYEDLVETVDLSEHELLFTGGDPRRAYAWRSYFLAPGLPSAWASLGFDVPESP